MRRTVRIILRLFLVAVCGISAGVAQEAIRYDIVIRNARVINPETNLDSTGLTVGIIGDRIAAIISGPLTGRQVIDAKGLILAPGFIDILSYAPGEAGTRNKIADGVTTNLAMHGGAAYPERWYRQYRHQRPPLNYGASFFYIEARNEFVSDRYAHASAKDIVRLTAIAERAVQSGALGISFSLEYCPGITPDEILPLMRVAKKYGLPVFFHARYSDMEEPGTNIDALNELVGYARETGAAVHVDHINSTGGTFSMARSLGILDSARAAGLDITACTYPYNFWATYLNSARFDPGWQQRFHITYGDLQLGGSAERLTAASFAKYRKEGKLAVAYAIPEEDVVRSLQSPFVMIGSDALLNSGFNNHPRASGAFCRTIGVYVRERRVLSLIDALAKMTILPARRLEKSCSAMKRKGRIQVGSDADLVVFDYDRIADRATVERPQEQSVGVEYVIVNGRVVKDLSGIRRNVRAGRSVKNDFAQ